MARPLRRAARLRRERPQLAIGVYQWLCGEKTYEELSEANKWDRLILETPLRGAKQHEAFWARVREMVASGEIEVSASKEHVITDAPLIEGGR